MAEELAIERVKALFETVLSSPLLEKVGRLIESRVGRPLEPFDIWYSGFRPRGAHTEAELDAIVKKRYPTPEAYEKDMPNLLEQLDFSPERAASRTRSSERTWEASLSAGPCPVASNSTAFSTCQGAESLVPTTRSSP